MTDLKVDPVRHAYHDDEAVTGIFVRARDARDGWCNVDIACLDDASLIAFVRSRGDVSTWGLHIILILLGRDREGVE